MQLLNGDGILILFRSALVVKLSGQEQIKVFLHIYTKCQRIFTTVAVEVKEKEKAYDRVIVSRIYYNENNSKDIIADMTKDFQKS